MNQTCQALCDASVDAESAKFINKRIQEDYNINWLVDGLPAAEMKQEEQTGEIFYDMGSVLSPRRIWVVLIGRLGSILARSKER